MRIGIAGAGLLGRLLAFELTRLGHAVEVFERGDGPQPPAPVGPRAAAWSAAGMLSPLAELESGDARLLDWGLRSLDRWQALLPCLPLPVPFQREGSLLLAHHADIGSARRFLGLIQARLGERAVSVQALDRQALAALEPALQGPLHAWQLQAEGQIQPVAAMQALAAAATAQGACWHWHSSVERVTPGQLWLAGRAQPLEFDGVFDVRGVGAHPQCPVRGVRGEIVWLHAPGVRVHRPLRLLHPRWRVYIVPHPEDILAVGASEIESEDLSPVSVRTVLGLLSAAYSVLPGLAEARIVRMESNLRPALPDNLPLLQCEPGLVRINGLFRHGWLLGPAIVADALQQAGLATCGVTAGGVA
jgi:glycine oxidase